MMNKLNELTSFLTRTILWGKQFVIKTVLTLNPLNNW